MNNVAENTNHKQEIRDKITEFKENLSKREGTMFNDCYPLEHSFADGCYVRQISVPKDNIVVTKIHKVDHPCFIMQGECSVVTDEGIKRVKAPMHFITKAGTQRIVYVHEDTVWVTVHVTEETDLEKIESQVIAETYDELPEDVKKNIEYVSETEQTKLLLDHIEKEGD